MALWELDPFDLELTLDHLVTLGEQPEDPHEALIYLDYLKNRPPEGQLSQGLGDGYGQALRSDQPLAALILELRTLGRRAPLRHRGFARGLEGLSAGKWALAIRSMKDQAAMGDPDATLALIRAAMETRDEPTLAALLEVLAMGLPNLNEAEEFIRLYEQDPIFLERLDEVRRVLLPPLSELQVCLPSPPLPPVATPLRTPGGGRNRTRKSLSVTELDGPGTLIVANQTGVVEWIKVASDHVEHLPSGYRYSTYISPIGAYKGGGQCRRIVASRLSDDLSLLVLFYHDNTAELLDRASGQPLGQVKAGSFKCFARIGKQILAGGPQGIINVRTHKLISSQPVRALGPRKLLVHEDGRVTLRGQECFQINPSYHLRLAPDGRSLALWDSYGEVEIFNLDGDLMGRFFAAESAADLSYDLDSRELILMQRGCLKRWGLNGQPLPTLRPHQSETPSRSAPTPNDGTLSLEKLAQYDSFFDRLRH